MKSLDLALVFLKNRDKVALSDKQYKWISDLRRKEETTPEGCLGFTEKGEAVYLKQAKRYGSAYGGGISKKGTGRFFLQINPANN